MQENVEKPDEFDEISSNIYPNSHKSAEELNMGLALMAMVNYNDEPNEWDEVMINGMLEKVEEAEAYFNLKYAKEIRETLGTS